MICQVHSNLSTNGIELSSKALLSIHSELVAWISHHTSWFSVTMVSNNHAWHYLLVPPRYSANRRGVRKQEKRGAISLSNRPNKRRKRNRKQRALLPAKSPAVYLSGCLAVGVTASRICSACSTSEPTRVSQRCRLHFPSLSKRTWPSFLPVRFAYELL